MSSPKNAIRGVFIESGKGMHSHGKLIKNLTKIYNKTSFDEFWESFEHHLKYSMIILKREPVVERTIEFAAKFASSLAKDQEKKEKPEKEVKESLEEEDEEEDDEMHPFLLKLFTFLLNSHNAGERAVRFRVCQLINKALNAMGEDVEIDDELYERIYHAMLQRLRDKLPVVRVQAVLAITRLQDPRDNDCPVINTFLFLLGCDPSADVRRAVLSCIAASTRTLAAILERTRDTKDVVRRLAFLVIAEKVHVRALTIAQRERLLRDGLGDRDNGVQDACSGRLLQAWLRVYEGNILELLDCLDVETTTETSEKAIRSMFQKANMHELVANFNILNDELVIPLEDMDAERAFYWRCLCEHLHGLGVEGEEALDKILPTGTVFANYVQSVRNMMAGEADVDIQLRNEFILQQLLELAAVIDLSDEVGRRNLDKLLRGLLVEGEVSHTLVEPLLKLYSRLHSNAESRVNQLIEIISDIRMPITQTQNQMSKEQQRKIDLKVASVRVELNQLREELDGAIHQQDFARAAEIKSHVSELENTKTSLLEEAEPKSQETRVEKTDPGTILKCLMIACEMLQDPQLTRLMPSVITLIETLIVPGIASPDPAVRNLAVKALGLCCLLSKDLAATHLLLFIQVSQMDTEIVKVTALQVIFDLLVFFGLNAFDVDSNIHDEEEEKDEEEEVEKDEEEEEEGESKKTKKAETACSIVSVLSRLLDSEVSEVRSVAAEGLCKLLLSHRLVSSKLVSRLLLLWYNPITEEDNYLRHCLGCFFPVYAFSGREGQSVMEEAFMPTLRTLLQAPATSPLAEVNMANVAELLVQLTDVRHLMENKNMPSITDIESCPHDSIALQVCNEILSDPNSFDVRVLCKVLVSVDLCPSNTATLADLKTLADRIVKDVKDKQCLKMVEKFQKQVYAMYAAAQPRPSQEHTPNKTPLLNVTGTENAANIATAARLNDTAASSGGDENKENRQNRTAGENELSVTTAEDGNTTQEDDEKESADKTQDNETLIEDASFHKIKRKSKKVSTASSSSSTASSSSTSRKSKTADTSTATTSIVEVDEDEVFESPPKATTTRCKRGRCGTSQTGRGRGGKRSTAAAVVATMEVEVEDSPARSTRASTRSTRKRNASKPLSDLKN